MEKIKGNKNIGSVLENRIQHAKRKITQSVDEAMNKRKKKKENRHPLKEVGRDTKKKNSGAKKNIIRIGYPVVKPMILKKKRFRRVSKNADYYKSVFD